MQTVNQIYNTSWQNALCGGIEAMVYEGLLPVVVTDPPFNIGYSYRTYSDKMDERDYYAMLAEVTSQTSSVVVHYPNMLHRLSIEKGEAPTKVVSWVYNANTPRQHRDIAFYGVEPDFKKVGQPYKNPKDKRVRKLIEQGKTARLYDWWNVSQVKNTSKEKTLHPCQMPLEVMERVVGVLPDGVGVIDPFMGSGTTCLACKRGGVPFIGYEIDKEYYKIAANRLKED